MKNYMFIKFNFEIVKPSKNEKKVNDNRFKKDYRKQIIWEM